LNCNPGSRREKLDGDSTIGYEIARRIRPNYVVCPTNNGTLLAGVWAGLKKSRAKPVMVAAVAKKSKIAASISGFHRFEEPTLSNCLSESKGETIDVSDEEIVNAAWLLLSDCMIVEGATAAAVASLAHLPLSRKTTVCCVITGNGLKFPTTTKELLKERSGVRM
jgi:threonine synthase